MCLFECGIILYIHWLRIVTDIPEPTQQSLEKVVLAYVNNVSNINRHLEAAIQQYLLQGPSLLLCFQYHALIHRIDYHSIDFSPFLARLLQDIINQCDLIQSSSSSSSIALLRLMSALLRETAPIHHGMINQQEYRMLWENYYWSEETTVILMELLEGVFVETLPFVQPCLFPSLLEVALRSALFKNVWDDWMMIEWLLNIDFAVMYSVMKSTGSWLAAYGKQLMMRITTLKWHNS